MNIIINSGGMLIIFGNFTATGSLTVNGDLVVGGTNIGISGNNKATFSGTGNVYAYNYDTGFIPSGQDKSIEPDLQNDLPDIYEFLVGGGESPLPVEVVYFRGLELNKSVKLEWATSLEENFDYFTIERSSDGSTFIDYGKTLSQTVYSSLIKKYEFVDEMPFPGLSYYRLKATDFNGSNEYHGLISVNLKNVHPDVLLYPNPIVGNQLTASFNGKEESTFIVYKCTGEIVKSGSIVPGINEIQFSPFIASGVYFFQIESVERTITKKFISK